MNRPLVAVRLALLVAGCAGILLLLAAPGAAAGVNEDAWFDWETFKAHNDAEMSLQHRVEGGPYAKFALVRISEPGVAAGEKLCFAATFRAGAPPSPANGSLVISEADADWSATTSITRFGPETQLARMPLSGWGRYAFEIPPTRAQNVRTLIITIESTTLPAHAIVASTETGDAPGLWVTQGAFCGADEPPTPREPPPAPDGSRESPPPGPTSPPTTTTPPPSTPPPDPSIAVPRPCSTEPSLRSSEGPRTTLTFVNEGRVLVDLLWLDYDGDRVNYATLAPGQVETRPTYATHPWVVADKAGNCRVIFVATSWDQRATIPPEPLSVPSAVYDVPPIPASSSGSDDASPAGPASLLSERSIGVSVSIGIFAGLTAGLVVMWGISWTRR